MDLQERVKAFLAGSPFAVVGATSVREKYGNKVLRVFMQHDHEVFPVNPRGGVIEGLTAYKDLSSIPKAVHGLSVITPPKITEAVVAEAAQLGIAHIWMQPGAENETAIRLAEEAGMNVIAGGPCILVLLGFHEDH
ncbi:MAG: CoA-binding protein [Acidobacteria bacterium]|nr:CoA-binding protein [Acidobacteriota bacterium]